jgi:prophage antirepressor-like protein
VNTVSQSASPGVAASPTKTELVNAARTVCRCLGLSLSENKIVRLVLRFKDKAPHGSKFLFFQFLCSAVDVNTDQRRAALLNSDVARVIGYSDPTGEQAVNNVLRQRR